MDREGLAGALVMAGQAWVLTMREGQSRRTRWKSVGLAGLENGRGGWQWLPWALNQGINPLDCGQVRESIWVWGEHLNVLVVNGVISEHTAHTAWWAARSWHSWLTRAMGWDCAVYDRAVTWDFLTPRRKLRAEPLSVSQLRALQAGAAKMAGGRETRLRTSALVAVVNSTGCRIAEAAGLYRDDVVIRQGNTGATATLHTKGGGRREVELPQWAVAQLQRYFRFREQQQVQLVGREPVFARTGLTYGRWQTVSVAVLRENLRQAARAGGVTQRVHPHLIRGSVITEALRRGATPYEVQAWSGHRREASVAAYDHRDRGQRVGQRIHELLDPGTT